MLKTPLYFFFLKTLLCSAAAAKKRARKLFIKTKVEHYDAEKCDTKIGDWLKDAPKRFKKKKARAGKMSGNLADKNTGGMSGNLADKDTEGMSGNLTDKDTEGKIFASRSS